MAIESSNLPLVIINTHGQTIVDEPKIEADMGIISFPVPLNTTSLLNIQSKFSQDIFLTVTDMSGRLVHKETISLFFGVNRIPINSDACSKGVYVIQIMNNKKEMIRKKIMK